MSEPDERALKAQRAKALVRPPPPFDALACWILIYRCAAREEAAAEKDCRGRRRDQAACARVARRVAAWHARGARTCARTCTRTRCGRGHRQPVRLPSCVSVQTSL
jgi:hypothetical protein